MTLPTNAGEIHEGERIIPLSEAHFIQTKDERIGDWLQTYTGKAFFPCDPRFDEFCIEDIAHALSLTCRYNGHTRVFYSVAQHSVMVGMECSPEYALEGLMHDAAEAYIGDVIRPLKYQPQMQGYREIEANLENVLAIWARLHYPWPDEVRRADNVLLATEARDVMVHPPNDWYLTEEPLPSRMVYAWHPQFAERTFLEYWHKWKRV